MNKKRIFIPIGVVALACVGVAFFSSRSQATTTTTETQLGKVTQATLSSVVESSGSVTPKAENDLSFGVSGTVSKVNVKIGDKVKKGDVLAELDTTDLELAVAQAQQAYLSQQATYSLTVNPDPNEVAAAELAVSNAAAAYQLAQQKYKVNSTDSVMLSCNNLEGQRSALFFYGTSGSVVWPWTGSGSTSYMCVKSPIGSYGGLVKAVGLMACVDDVANRNV